MKITYKENPLAATVELDEHEKEIFKLKLRLKEYEEMIFEAHFELTQNEWHNKNIKPRTLEEAVAKACKQLDPEYWCTDELSKLDKRVDELFEHYIAELQDHHGGDCTCFACSCSKCHAEEMLGIDTLKPYPGKHQLHKIESAFRHPEITTCEEAITHLQSQIPFKATEEWHKGHEVRWTAETVQAIEYLRQHQLKLKEQS